MTKVIEWHFAAAGRQKKTTRRVSASEAATFSSRFSASSSVEAIASSSNHIPFAFFLIRNVFSWPFQDSKWSMKLTIFNVQAPSEATSQTKTKVIWEWQIRISHRPIIQFWEGNLWPKSTAALSCHDEFIKQKVKTEIFVQNYFKRHFCITLWSKI